MNFKTITFMSEKLTSNNIQNDEFNLSNKEIDYKNLVIRLKNISFMSENLNSINSENDESNQYNEDNDFNDLIIRLKEIKSTIALLEKKIFK